MRAYVAIADGDWFRHLAAQPGLDEANFWKPASQKGFKALEPGELLLFKLHAPDNFVAGGGVFAHFSRLPCSLAWEAFGEKNGAGTLPEMRARIEKYRRAAPSRENYTIGCVLLVQPFFLPRERWVPVPPDFSSNTQVGKRYDLETGFGLELWRELQAAMVAVSVDRALDISTARETPAGGGATPRLVTPRLGQGSFRVMVTDAYDRRCVVTGERTLPALEAAHIKPYAESGGHRLSNGLLLRADIHALFDRGYVTVTPQRRFEVSPRIREEFENGRDYYRLAGAEVRAPLRPQWGPDPQLLRWHNENVFRA